MPNAHEKKMSWLAVVRKSGTGLVLFQGLGVARPDIAFSQKASVLRYGRHTVGLTMQVFEAGFGLVFTVDTFCFYCSNGTALSCFVAMFKSPLMFLFATAAIRASSDGPCYNIDGSRDKGSSACYDLDTVGASMCCVGTEKCRVDGLCTGSPRGLVGPYDDDTAFWRRSCTDYTWQDPACMAIASCRNPGPPPLPPRSLHVLKRLADETLRPQSSQLPQSK